MENIEELRARYRSAGSAPEPREEHTENDRAPLISPELEQSFDGEQNTDLPARDQHSASATFEPEPTYRIDSPQPEQSNLPAALPTRGSEEEIAVAKAKTQGAQTGFLGWLNRTFNLNIAPGESEQAYDQWVRSINLRVTSPKVVGFVSPKGGVGKTVLNQAIGSTIAEHRSAGGVVGIDADAQSMLVRRMKSVTGKPERGRSITTFSRDTSLRGDGTQVKNYLTVNEEGYSVLPGAALSAHESPSEAEIATALRILAKHYELILLDLPGAREALSTKASLGMMDGMVYVMTTTADSLWLGKQHLEQIAAKHPDLLDRTIVLLNHQTSEPLKVDLDKEREAIARLGRSGDPLPVYEVAFDEHMHEGGGMSVDLLKSANRNDFVKIAAALFERLDLTAATTVSDARFDAIGQLDRRRQ